MPSLLCSVAVGFTYWTYKTDQQQTNWDLKRNMKAAHEIFKKSPARKSGYLAANDSEMTDYDSSVWEDFPLEFCGHRWLENGKILTRVLKVMEMMVKFLMEYRAAKKFPAKGKQFPLLLRSTTSTIFPTYCEFSQRCKGHGTFLNPFWSQATTGCIFVQTVNEGLR